MGAYPVLLLFAALVAVARDADARTWHVERDGSGDFTVIQDAVDAAASGDSILIGPGRYDDFRAFDPGTGGIPSAIIGIDKGGLHLIGDSRDSVTIGPASLVESYEGRLTNCVTVGGSISTSYVSGVTLENASNLAELYSTTEWTESVFQLPSQIGVMALDGENHFFRECVFQDDGTLHFLGQSIVAPRIADCTFRRSTILVLQGSQDATVEACRFELNSIDVQFAQNATGSVRNCSFVEESSFAQLVVTSGARVTLTGSEFRGTAVRRIVVVTPGSGIAATDNIFEGASLATIELKVSEPGDAVFHNNTILNGGGWSVDAVADFQDPHWVDLDLTNNWWGTSDAQQIREWIRDGNDVPYETTRVLFEPFRPRPLASQKRSLGSLKAGY